MSNSNEMSKAKNNPGDSSADDGYGSDVKVSVIPIPKQFLNQLGFINYDHYGKKPWTYWDEAKGDIVLPPNYTSVTNILGIDCEMVGVGEYKDSALARVSIVNEFGYCIYDTFAKPKEDVTDYRTKFSGVRAEDLLNAPNVEIVVAQVAQIVESKVLVGHSIHNDLDVLKLTHPRNLIRDTAIFFKKLLKMKGTPSLKDLAIEYLRLSIQSGEHSSIQDAQATLKLYLQFRGRWEEDFTTRRQNANLSLDSDSFTMTTPDDISDMHVEPREPDLYVDSKTVFLRENKVIGAYTSCEEYLDVQFRLLLEDFLRPLRDCVKNVNEWRKFKKNSIFYNVKISKGENSVFEVKRSGTLLVPIERNNLKDVDWEESKIFLNGSLLLLTPDDFKSAKFAVIKYRPEEQTNPHFLALHVEFSKDGASWTVGETNNRFMMMESPAFYEAYKHSLEYLQTVDLNKFPLTKYIVDAVTAPRPPKYLRSVTNELDFSVLMGSSDDKTLLCRKAFPLDLSNWPNANELNLEESQFEAFQKALTQEMTIIQGPPGTGKTFIGIQIAKLLLSNDWLLNSPILIVSYTNHALDQTLEQVLDFVTNSLCAGNANEAQKMILRVGGGSESEIIKPLVLTYKLDKFLEKKRHFKKLDFLQRVLNSVKDLNFKDCLIEQGILDFQNLPKVILDRLCQDDKRKAAFDIWTNLQGQIKKDPFRWFGLEKKDAGIIEKAKNNQKHKLLMVSFDKNFDVSSHLNSMHKILVDSVKTVNLQDKLDDSNGDKIKMVSYRWIHYLYLVRCVKQIVDETKQRVAILQQEYLNMEHFLSKNLAIRGAKVIGMTTTGAVKHKYIVNMTKPKIMIVEEAAHVLEAHVVCSLTEHCQQMVMIGDHKQLRPMTADYNLATDYNLDVSLMERLVKNGIQQGNRNWTQLKVQHRMRPEIARMVCPAIYEELHDHPNVRKYPAVKGCSKNLFFVDHRNGDGKEIGSRSYCNKYEVNFLVGLVKYFVNGSYYHASRITVIATYAAQKQLIQDELKRNIQCQAVRVSTVDGYQGEENDIILLSLVRNNEKNSVGFLKTDNRVCVALSRARHGLFMIGNMSCLKAESETWKKINEILIEMNCIGGSLPLTGSGFTMKPVEASLPIIKNHVNRTIFNSNQNVQVFRPAVSSPIIKKLSEVNKNANVQRLPCGHQQLLTIRQIQMNNLQEVKCTTVMMKKLTCGHVQKVPCHQTNGIICDGKQKKVLPCGHLGMGKCGEDAKKVICNKIMSKLLLCGHLQMVRCSSNLSNVKCTVTVSKVLPCGHNQNAHCHQKVSTIKCNVAACCGHYKDASRQNCNVLVAKTLPCGHTVQAPCGNKISDIKCNVMLQSKLRCKHFQKYPCHLRDQYKCSYPVVKELPCGHTQGTACHLNPKDVYCKTLLTTKCSHRVKVDCSATKNKKAVCNQRCYRVFKCGHQCRFLCHETNKKNPNHLHLQYRCIENCQRGCPVGHPCPGNHHCWLNCPVKAGNCPQCVYDATLQKMKRLKI